MTNDYWRGVIIVSMYFACSRSAWNLLAGYTGQFSLAPATFGMIGAYTTGLLAYHFGGTRQSPAFRRRSWSPGVIGFILAPHRAAAARSLPRAHHAVLRRDHATGRFGNSIDITRGDLGLSVPGLFDGAPCLLLRDAGGARCGPVRLVSRCCAAPAGLYLRAIRDDEVAAAGRGVKVVRWKTYAFALSAAISGLAGALYGHFAQLVSPELGLISQTGIIISMVVIGGLGTLVGPIGGAFLVYVASEFLRDFGGYQLIVFALLVIVFARFFRARPVGVAARRLRTLAPRARPPRSRRSDDHAVSGSRTT